MKAKQLTAKEKLQGKKYQETKFQGRASWPLSFNDITKKELESYDKFIVAFSGGKDSIACVLYLLELGIPKSKMELWHHCVDGREGSDLMDWDCTESYCSKFAKEMGLPLYFSWKVGGFEGEMLRENSKTKPTKFEIPVDNPEEDNLIECGGEHGTENTRMMFPQVSADLRVRWCSSYLKIGVCTAAINNQDRFLNKKIMTISGERAEESPARSNYLEVDIDPSDRRDGKRVKRYVDRCRPIHKWNEAEVWDIMKRWKINPHWAYQLGWGRLSCMACIFGSKSQWASIKEIAPKRFDKIARYERQFGKTIHRSKTVKELAKDGQAYKMNKTFIKKATSKEYTDPIFVEDWVLPAGAFGESNGPS